jgi:exodeoxyribonuclease V gamma subunit
MAITIHSSNRVETLQSRLSQQLASKPLADPFRPEIIVVPTYAMARWLNLRIAQQQGIAANIQYPQAAEWIWSLASTLLEDAPGSDPCSRGALAWWVFNDLPALLGQGEFAQLRRYLQDDHSGIKRWQLSQRIADCFDRYQSYRPNLIKAWSNGADDHWQARLWHSVVTANRRLHRLDVIGQIIACLDDDKRVLELPERISLFALSRLAPCYMDVVEALARRTEVLLFQHHPTDQYWADLVSEKEQARKRLQNPAHDTYFDSGNPLLTSWGRQGQVMQDLLLELGSITAREVEDNHPPGNDTLLQSLQSSLFYLEPPSKSVQVDDSISVHLCHSPMRECQVLHDHLLTLLDRHADLCSEDILVMVPEISRYAPYIEAIFQHDSSNKRPNLAWNISDISVTDNHPLAGVFLQLLNLPDSRFTRSEVLSFLECAELRECFGLDRKMLEEINRLTEVAQVRWGIDANQRRAMGLPAIHENTWQQAWERLFAGYAMPNDDLWQGIAPISEVDSDSAIAIARFRYLFERLIWWHGNLATAASATDWQDRLHQLIEEFLAAGAASDDLLQPLRQAISELGQSGSRELSPVLVSYWMEKQLATTQQPGRLYSGGISFCGMQPMRNIPFPVICVLGMQDNAFPRRQQSAEFDLMRDHLRAGDPHKGDEDRYLMLETLLCARRYLYFSYCGRSLKDNSECQPSVLLRELLDYIDSGFIADEEQQSPSSRITRVHPMQAFSLQNFTAASPGYDRHWFDTALLIEDEPARQPAANWARQPLRPAPETEKVLDLDLLNRFYQHPIRYFFNTRLGIRIPFDQASEDEEVFSLQGLHKWAIASQLAEAYLDGEPLERTRFSARGLLPHGSAASSEWYAVLSEYQGLFEDLAEFQDQPRASKVVECQLDDGRLLCGEVRQFYPGMGLMQFSASKSIKARSLISLWLNHLALCAAQQLSSTESSQLLAPGTSGFRFGWLDAAKARALLANYVELMQQGLDYPLPVFPDTSYAWAREADPDTAMSKAALAWKGGQFGSAIAGECDDAYIRLALHNNITDPLNDMLFQQYARRIYQPAIDHGGPID